MNGWSRLNEDTESNPTILLHYKSDGLVEGENLCLLIHRAIKTLNSSNDGRMHYDRYALWNATITCSIYSYIGIHNVAYWFVWLAARLFIFKTYLQ